MKTGIIKRAAAVLSCAAIMLFSGCSETGLGDQTIMRPPRATGDQAAIQKVISEQAVGGYVLKYPKNGEYRSAINIFKDSDGKEYAVALYSTENESKMKVSVILNENNEWKCLGTLENTGVGIDRILFRDINSDNHKEIFVGWSGYNSGINTLSVYSLENDIVRDMVVNENYTDIVITDITGDKAEDIVLLSLRNNQTPSSAKLLQYSDQEKKPIPKFSLDLDSEVTSFTSIQHGAIESGKEGIVIDGAKGAGQLTTQVIYYDPQAQALKNPLVTVNESGTYTNVTTRKDMITSRDINGDGVIEIPVVTPMPAPTDTDAGEICNMTAWKQISSKDGTLKTKQNTIMNYTDGYYFIMPDRWNKNVTAKNDPAKRSLTFYIWSSKNSSLGDKLLTIRRYMKTEWNSSDHKGSVMLQSISSSESEAVIAGEIFETKAMDSLNITKDELESSVKLIN